MLGRLSNPEYVHVLLNPLPVYGLALGVLSLAAALFSRAQAARILALIIIFVCALSAWPVYQFGKTAYDPVLALADNDGQLWLEEHARRAEKLIYGFGVCALLAGASLAAEWKGSRFAFSLAIATLLVAALSLGAGSYISSTGGRIRHREFRYEPPPPSD